MRRVTILLLVLAFGGCGSEDADRLRERVQALEQRARAEADQLRERFRDILTELERKIPEARQTSPEVRRGREDVDEFLTTVLANIDGYWTETLRENGLPEPSVFYVWVPPGRQAASACGPAGDAAAFYCSADDTIYVSQRFAADLWDGVLGRLPGEGRAAGDFGVAYVVAHEYAHNLQAEFGVFEEFRGATVRPLELQADCFAGAWGNSVYKQGPPAAGRHRRGDRHRARGRRLRRQQRATPRHPRRAPCRVAARLRERRALEVRPEC